jgi:putative spermidine/putrescine transport system substrate-binding protein
MKELFGNRRHFIGAGLNVIGWSAFSENVLGQSRLPKTPVSINVVDGAGDLALTQRVFDNYRMLKPQLVSKFTFSKAPQPEIPSKLKAQQAANRVDIDLVLTAYDGLALGTEQGVYQQLLPNYASALPKLDDIYHEGARKVQAMMKGYGVVVAYCPYGPLLEYMPERVKNVPTTAEDLLAWTRANKNRFFYARAANSGPSRAFLVGLPYILGDINPKDPVKGWDKTWAYLKALGENIEYYPSGTSAVLKEFGEGSRDLIPSSTGWDINPRALGVVPKEARITTLKGFHWMSDAHCWCIPKGVSEEKVAVILDLMSFMLTKSQQAITYDKGYSYPGPAVKGVTLDMAPIDSQEVIKEYGRPEYEALIANTPHETPLDPAAQVLAFRRWDEEIGGAKRR